MLSLIALSRYRKDRSSVHPFWVVTDEPDLERAARGLVDENGVWLYHENIGPTENGFWVEASVSASVKGDATNQRTENAQNYRQATLHSVVHNGVEGKM